MTCGKDQERTVKIKENNSKYDSSNLKITPFDISKNRRALRYKTPIIISKFVQLSVHGVTMQMTYIGLQNM